MLYGTFIELPDDIASSTLHVSGGLVSDLSPVWTMVVGVILAVLVVGALVSLLRHH